jgi:hypothetical protein
MGRIQYRSTSKLVAIGIHLTRGLLSPYDKYVLNPFLSIPIAKSRVPSYI